MVSEQETQTVCLRRNLTVRSVHTLFPYNPLIAEVLYKSSFLESWGSGVSRMVEACRSQGLPEPEYEVRGGFVAIVFKKKAETTEKILRLISERPNITTEELSQLCGLTVDGVYYHTKKLREKGLLIREGGRKEGHWIVVKD